MRSPVRVENHAVVGEIEIRARPEKVFQALTDPNQVVTWWGAPDVYHVTKFHLEPHAGGRWRLHATTWAREEFQVCGDVIEYDPPRALALTWNPSWQQMPTTIVRFELEPSGGGTLVRLSHSGFRPDNVGLETHRYGWPLVLNWLAASCV